MTQLKLTYPVLDAKAEKLEPEKPKLEDISLHAKQLWQDGANAIAIRILNRIRFAENGCLECMGANTRGYGVITINHKVWLVHRVSYLLWIGEIPNGLYVCHKCDNHRCMLPSHLFIGSAKDNYQDSKNKGRNSRGEKHGHSKLTSEQVIQIRKAYKWRTRESNMYVLATCYNVSQRLIQNIIHRKIWKHI